MDYYQPASNGYTILSTRRLAPERIEYLARLAERGIALSGGTRSVTGKPCYYNAETTPNVYGEHKERLNAIGLGVTHHRR